MEAIYLLGRLRSFRAARLRQLISHGQQRARVAARVVWPGLSSRVEIDLGARGKRVRVDGKGIDSIREHCSRFRIVIFEPGAVDLPRGAPRERRRFLDRAIFNHRPAYLAEAVALEEVLKSRNALLRSARGKRPDLILMEGYERQLAEAGARVACRRRDFVQEIRGHFAGVFEEILGDPRRPGDLVYRSTVPGVQEGEAVAEVASRYFEALVRSRARDLERCSTSLGPHRDDLEMSMAGRELKEHASQGQHRLFVLALKITEIETLKMLRGARPILLLDDISSELDESKSRYLFRCLSRLRSQVFITTTSPRHVYIPAERKDFKLQGGRLWNAS